MTGHVWGALDSFIKLSHSLKWIISYVVWSEYISLWLISLGR